MNQIEPGGQRRVFSFFISTPCFCYNTPMTKQSIHRSLFGIALILAFIALACLSGSLWQRIESINHRHLIGAGYPRPVSRQNYQPLTPDNVANIQSWMTFDYVETIFAVPADYVAADLGLSDPRYPRITISRYARSHGIDAQALVDELKGSIERYSPALYPPSR